MTVSVATLETEIRKINDSSFGSFGGWPTVGTIGTRWATAYAAYIYGGSAGGVPVTPGSLASSIAATAPVVEAAAIGGTFSLAVLEATFWAAMSAAAAAIFPTPAPPAVSITPPTPVVEAPIFAANLAGVTAQVAANNIAVGLDGFVSAGTAIVVYPAPPAGIGPQVFT